VLRHLKSIFLFFLFICAKKSWEVSQEVNNVDLSPRSVGNRCPFDQKHATPGVSQWYRRCRSCSFNAIFFKVAIAVFSLYGLYLRHKYTDMRHNDTENRNLATPCDSKTRIKRIYATPCDTLGVAVICLILP